MEKQIEPQENNETGKMTETAEIAPETAAPSPKHSRKTKLIILSLALIIAIAGACYLAFKPAKKVKSEVKTAATPSPKPTTEDAAILERLTHPTTGETWYSTPKKLTAQGFLRDEQNTTYYEVGKRDKATIIMSVTQELGPHARLFEVAPGGYVTAIQQPDANATYESDDGNTAQYDALVKTVSIDKSIRYDSLTTPTKLKVGAYTLTKAGGFSLGSFIDPVEKQTAVVTTLATYGATTVRKVSVANVSTHLTAVYFDVLLPSHTALKFNYKPLESELKNATWKNGVATDDTAVTITQGCSNLNADITVADNITNSDVSIAGKSASGVELYELSSIDHPLMTKAYDEFIEFFKEYPDSNADSSISKAGFAKKHALILIRDTDGKWLAYARQNFRPAGGCAKPVVYLYPTKTQSVHVSVGAVVKISLPTYDPKAGWTVVARPDGMLTTGGQTYDSLFWEGLGSGRYPGIISGTVVHQNQLISTIRAQLTAQGLNQKESNDFLAYWKTKLPAKPYVRLTWLGAAEMNQLAPLSVSPRPDTVIRVFLDAEGLDAPIALPAQHLTSTSRNGFTVVEWGGLAGFQLK